MGLPARKVETVAPGRYTDDRGLQLLVESSGQRSWGLRYQADGRDLGLGPEITLAKARERRRRLMEDWAEFVTRPNAQAGEILELRRASR